MERTNKEVWYVVIRELHPHLIHEDVVSCIEEYDFYLKGDPTKLCDLCNMPYICKHYDFQSEIYYDLEEFLTKVLYL